MRKTNGALYVASPEDGGEEVTLRVLLALEKIPHPYSDPILAPIYRLSNGGEDQLSQSGSQR